MKKTTNYFKLISTMVVAIFTFTTIAWSAPACYTIKVPEDKGKVVARYKAPIQNSPLSKGVPEKAGDVSDENNPLTPFTKGDFDNQRQSAGQDAQNPRESVEQHPRTVVLVQDAHSSFEAQDNIAAIIENLLTQMSGNSPLSKGVPEKAGDVSDENNPLTPFTKGDFDNQRASAINGRTPFIGVEGAIGDVDVTQFRDFPLDEVRHIVGQDFVKKGVFTGSELAAIASPDEIPLYGVEDPELFKQNFRAFYKVSLRQSELEHEIEVLEGCLDQLKEAIFNEKLKTFDTAASLYEQSQSNLMMYLGTLYSALDEAGIDPMQYMALTQFNEVFSRGQMINDEAIDREITNVGDALRTYFDENQIAGKDELDRHIKAWQEKTETRKDCGQYVFAVAQKAGMSGDNYPMLRDAIIYWRAYAAVDMNKLLQEVLRAGHDIRMQFAVNSREKELVELTATLVRFKQLVSLQAVKEDVDDFRAHKEQYSIDAMIATLKKCSEESGVAISIPQVKGDFSVIMEEVDAFYQAAEARDIAMLNNLLTKMDSNNTDVGVLIAGGYHTDGMVKALKERGISYVTVMPTITSTVKDVAYMDRMMGKIAPLSPAMISGFQPNKFVAFLSAITSKLEQDSEAKKFIDEILTTASSNEDIIADLQKYTASDNKYKPVADVLWERFNAKLGELKEEELTNPDTIKAAVIEKGYVVDTMKTVALIDTVNNVIERVMGFDPSVVNVLEQLLPGNDVDDDEDDGGIGARNGKRAADIFSLLKTARMNNSWDAFRDFVLSTRDSNAINQLLQAIKVAEAAKAKREKERGQKETQPVSSTPVEKPEPVAPALKTDKGTLDNSRPVDNERSLAVESRSQESITQPPVVATEVMNEWAKVKERLSKLTLAEQDELTDIVKEEIGKFVAKVNRSGENEASIKRKNEALQLLSTYITQIIAAQNKDKVFQQALAAKVMPKNIIKVVTYGLGKVESIPLAIEEPQTERKQSEFDIMVASFPQAKAARLTKIKDAVEEVVRLGDVEKVLQDIKTNAESAEQWRLMEAYMTDLFMGEIVQVRESQFVAAAADTAFQFEVFLDVLEEGLKVRQYLRKEVATLEEKAEVQQGKSAYDEMVERLSVEKAQKLAQIEAAIERVIKAQDVTNVKNDINSVLAKNTQFRWVQTYIPSMFESKAEREQQFVDADKANQLDALLGLLEEGLKVRQYLRKEVATLEGKAEVQQGKSAYDEMVERLSVEKAQKLAQIEAAIERVIKAQDVTNVKNDINSVLAKNTQFRWVQTYIPSMFESKAEREQQFVDADKANQLAALLGLLEEGLKVRGYVEDKMLVMPEEALVIDDEAVIMVDDMIGMEEVDELWERIRTELVRNERSAQQLWNDIERLIQSNDAQRKTTEFRPNLRAVATIAQSVIKSENKDSALDRLPQFRDEVLDLLRTVMQKRHMLIEPSPSQDATAIDLKGVEKKTTEVALTTQSVSKEARGTYEGLFSFLKLKFQPNAVGSRSELALNKNTFDTKLTELLIAESILGQKDSFNQIYRILEKRYGSGYIPFQVFVEEVLRNENIMSALMSKATRLQKEQVPTQPGNKQIQTRNIAAKILNDFKNRGIVSEKQQTIDDAIDSSIIIEGMVRAYCRSADDSNEFTQILTEIIGNRKIVSLFVVSDELIKKHTIIISGIARYSRYFNIETIKLAMRLSNLLVNPLNASESFYQENVGLKQLVMVITPKLLFPTNYAKDSFIADPSVYEGVLSEELKERLTSQFCSDIMNDVMISYRNDAKIATAQVPYLYIAEAIMRKSGEVGKMIKARDEYGAFDKSMNRKSANDMLVKGSSSTNRMFQGERDSNITLTFEMSTSMSEDERANLESIIWEWVSKVKEESWGRYGEFVQGNGEIRVTTDEDMYEHQKDGIIYIPYANLQRASKEQAYYDEGYIKMYHEFCHESTAEDVELERVIKMFLPDIPYSDEVREFVKEIVLTTRNRVELLRKGALSVGEDNAVFRQAVDEVIKGTDQTVNTIIARIQEERRKVENIKTIWTIARQMAIIDAKDMINKGIMKSLVVNTDTITNHLGFNKVIIGMGYFDRSLSLGRQWEKSVKDAFEKKGVNFTDVWKFLDSVSQAANPETINIFIGEDFKNDKAKFAALNAFIVNKEITSRMQIKIGDLSDFAVKNDSKNCIILKTDSDKLPVSVTPSTNQMVFQFVSTKTNKEESQKETMAFNSILLLLVARYIEALSTKNAGMMDSICKQVFSGDGLLKLNADVAENLNENIAQAVMKTQFKMAA